MFNKLRKYEALFDWMLHPKMKFKMSILKFFGNTENVKFWIYIRTIAVRK
jgi:hypothetical protein